MIHLKLFDSYEAELEKQNIEYNKSIKNYSEWIPKIYSYWKEFQEEFQNKIGKLPFDPYNITTSNPKLGYGKDLKSLLFYINKYKNPNDLVKHFNDTQKRVFDMREKMKDRWDLILNSKGTKEEYKMLNSIRELNDELTDLHFIWTTCFEEKSFDVFYEIEEIIRDFAEDNSLSIYLGYVELFRGLELSFILTDENADIEMSATWDRRTQIYNYTGVKSNGKLINDDVHDKTKYLEKVLNKYFLNVYIRYTGKKHSNIITIGLNNQIK